MERALLFLAACTATLAFAGGQLVRFPGDGLDLEGQLRLPEGRGPFPAVVMLHGCGGLWDRNGNLTPLYESWTRLLRDGGYATLLVDSFRPRGEREICTQKERTVSEVRDRPKDAHAALRWLASRGEVDPSRIHLMGWSNGAMTVLNALDSDGAAQAGTGPHFRSAIAFYPGCARSARRPYRPAAPLLILSGGADDWTPARHCIRLVQEAKVRGEDVEIDVYEGAYHGFDAPGTRVKFRPEVRNPSSPSGWGATVGANADARKRAIRRAMEYLDAHR